MKTRSEAISLLNELGGKQEPFLFYCDFQGNHWEIQTVTEYESEPRFRASFRESFSQPSAGTHHEPGNFESEPTSYELYKKAFDYVRGEIKFGNSFLTNLTFKTPIQADLSLADIYHASGAKYKLLVPEQFVVFSPETFVKIRNSKIFSFPMKGTIDSAIPGAVDLILNDQKETAEHVTIVDLIRNDLSQVATHVQVPRFRYTEEIKTNGKNLIQVSSEVRGELPADWKSDLGSILSSLLPAGSISGAPKPETIKIIKQAENYDRGFYTGICGHFDGRALDSAVMIRFVVQEQGQLYYCSGGGITSQSDPRSEYQEMIDKIYIPVNR